VQVADGNFPIQVKLAGYYELNGFIFVKERSNFNFSMKKMPVPVVKDTIPEISFEGLATNNWVFLLDISASMNTPEKLPLIREGLKSIVDLFRNEDRVAIVTFSGSAKEILPSTNGMNKDKIIQAIDNIQPGGKSEGATAVNAAYDVAIKNFIPGGNNRIIIATDGLFTSGDKDLKAIKKILKKHLAKDIRCSVFLVGKPGAMVKNELQQIADTGQGNLVQIADEQEARQKMFEEAKNNH
jgi:Ca-activated chloride channel family protein